MNIKQKTKKKQPIRLKLTTQFLYRFRVRFFRSLLFRFSDILPPSETIINRSGVRGVPPARKVGVCVFLKKKFHLAFLNRSENKESDPDKEEEELH